MRKISRVLLGIFVSLMLVSEVNAEENSTYIFGDVGLLNSGDLCSASSGATVNSCPSSTTAYRLGVGYTLSNGFGLEIAYANLGSFAATGSVLVSGTNYGFHMNTTQSAFLVPATYNFNLNDSTALVLKLGVAFTQGAESATLDSTGANFMNTSAGSTAAIYGIGITEKITDKFYGRVQYEVINKFVLDTTSNTGINNLGLISFGGAYKF